MTYNRKSSKALISEFCSSREFESFKSALEKFSGSLEGESLNEVVESVQVVDKTMDAMLNRVNSALKYTIDSYLTEAQIQEIDMESSEEGIALSYKHYIPIYVSEEGVYSTVDSTLLVVNYERKEILVKDLSSVFDKAAKSSKYERTKEEARYDTYKQKIAEMESNRGNSAYVINKVNKYNKDAIKNKTFEKIKCLISKNVYAEYLAAYDDIVDELIKETQYVKEDLKREKPFNYNDKCKELKDLQKGLLRRLFELNFNVKYENEQDVIVRNPINIQSLYRV